MAFKSILTDEGINKLLDAQANSVPVNLTNWKVGSTANIALVSTLTDVVSEIDSGTVSDLQFDITSDDQVLVRLILGEARGDYTVGNIGLYDDSGTLVTIGTFDNGEEPKKVANTVFAPGNRLTFNLPIAFVNVGDLINFNLFTNPYSSWPFADNSGDLPPALSAPFEGYILRNEPNVSRAVIAIRDEVTPGVFDWSIDYHNLIDNGNSKVEIPTIGGDAVVVTNGVEALRVNTSQNVTIPNGKLGVGTSPSYSVDVLTTGDFGNFVSSTQDAVLRLESTFGASEGRPKIDLRQDGITKSRIGLSTSGGLELSAGGVVTGIIIDTSQNVTIPNGILKLIDGTVSSPSLSLTDVGIYRPLPNVMVLTAGGSDRLIVSNAAITARGVVRAPLGDVTNPSFSFETNTNTGIYRPAADQLAISLGGALRLNIANGGVNLYSNVLAVPNGSASNPSYTFNDDQNTGVFRISEDRLGFATGGISKVDLTTSRLRCTIPIYLEVGNPSAPSLAYESATSTGVHFFGSNFNISHGGADKLVIESGRTISFNRIEGVTGSVTLPAYSFNLNANTGIYSPATNQLAITTGGVQGLLVDASQDVTIPNGNLGINISGTPGAALEVNGKFLFNNAVNGVINTPNSLFINIDSNNNATVEKFVIGKDTDAIGTELFKVEENGNVTIPSGQLIISTPTPISVFKDTNATGTTQMLGYVSFQDSTNSELGWVGYGDVVDSDLTLRNTNGNAVLSSTSGSVILKINNIEGLKVDLNHDVTLPNGGLVVGGTSPVSGGFLNVLGGKIVATNTGVDGTYLPVLQGTFSSNNLETNILSSSVSSAANNSGWKFSVSNGGGVATTTDALRINRDAIRSLLPMYLADGGLSSPSLTFNSAPDTGILLSDTNEIGFVTGGGVSRAWMNSTEFYMNGNIRANGEVSAKNAYGDVITIGGDGAGDDYEIRINAPAARNQVSFYNSTVGVAPKVVAGTLTLNQVATTFNIVELGSSGNVAHGMTGIMPTHVYGIMAKIGDTTGGLLIRGAGSASQGLHLSGVCTTPNTDISTLNASIILNGAKKSGTTSTAMASGDVLFQIANNGVPKVSVNGAGELFLDQGANDGAIITFKSSDIAHGITGVAETSAYGFMNKAHSTAGALHVAGLGEGTQGVYISGHASTSATAGPTFSGSTITVNALLKSGIGTTSFSDSSAIFQIQNAGTAKLTIQGSGSLYTRGSVTSEGDISCDGQIRGTATTPNITLKSGTGGPGHVYFSLNDGVNVCEVFRSSVNLPISSGILNIGSASETCLAVNRNSSDGTLISFEQAGIAEGSISVSGTTVTYGSFAGSHWSQLTNSTRDATIEQGTVMSTIDEMCEWSGEDNEQLARCKISNVVGDKSVYGVFMGYDDNDGDNPTNDMNIVSLGAYVIKVTGTCSNGDLLESNGDGTARVQADDIIRSSTIGKVTHGSQDSGVKLVPCVLYCG